MTEYELPRDDRAGVARRPGLWRRAAAMERATWINLARWITRRPAVPAGATGFPYSSAMNPVLIAFIAVSAIEIPVAHLLIPWTWLQLIVLIFGIWGLGWMLGLLASVQLHPHLADRGGLRIRNAASIDLAVPWDAIASVGQRLRSLDSSKALQQQETRGGTAVIVAVTSQTNLELRLNRPVIFELTKGPVEAIEVRCYADDPAAMAAAIRAKITSVKIAEPKITGHDHSGATSGRSSQARPISRRR
jgi:hypothetical protein